MHICIYSNVYIYVSIYKSKCIYTVADRGDMDSPHKRVGSPGGYSVSSRAIKGLNIYIYIYYLSSAFYLCTPVNSCRALKPTEVFNGIYILIRVYVYFYGLSHVYTYIYMYMYIYVYICIYMYIYMGGNPCHVELSKVNRYMCMNTYLCVYIFRYMYLCIYVYAYI
jgi:hypothetical protein